MCNNAFHFCLYMYHWRPLPNTLSCDTELVMATTWRRPSAFPVDNELSLSQTDEIRIKSTPVDEISDEKPAPGSLLPLSKEKKQWTIWIIYFIGFMVGCLGVHGRLAAWYTMWLFGTNSSTGVSGSSEFCGNFIWVRANWGCAYILVLYVMDCGFWGLREFVCPFLSYNMYTPNVTGPGR